MNTHIRSLNTFEGRAALRPLLDSGDVYAGRMMSMMMRSHGSSTLEGVASGTSPTATAGSVGVSNR